MFATRADAKNWNALTIPRTTRINSSYSGFPILKNKLFYFGDIEANRIA
jgi:hypothetical protein